MLMVRGLGGLGEPLTEGYCLKNGVWTWTTAAQCAEPLQPGGPPAPPPVGFCWNRQNPPAPFPGNWMRIRAGQTSCPFDPPPSAPSGGGVVVREHRADEGGVPGGGVVVAAGPTSGAMTAAGVERLRVATFKAYYWEREPLAVKAWAATAGLPPCPLEVVERMKQGGAQSPTTMAATIPGTFEVYGVPFNIAEPGVTKSPRFERLYTPNNEQRILIEGQIIKRSNELRQAALVRALRDRGASDPEAFIRQFSVQQVLELLPRWKLAVPGMAIQSAPPTQAELTTAGGYASWAARGFLISLDVAEGKERLADRTLKPMAKASNTCLYNDRPVHFVTGVEVDDDPDLPTGNFWWYAKIEPTGQVRLIGEHDDPSWLQRFAGVAGGIMTKLGNLACGAAQPALQAQLQTTVAEKCVDKAGKPCTKGATDCTCTSVSAATSGGVGLFNFVAGKLCAGWLAEYAQDPQAPLPQIPDPVPLKVTPTWLRLAPWILGGLALGAGGAYAFAKR